MGKLTKSPQIGPMLRSAWLRLKQVKHNECYRPVQLQWYWHPSKLCLQGLIVKPISPGRQQSSRQMAQLTYKMLNQVNPCATSTSNHLAVPICKPIHRSQRRSNSNLRLCHRLSQISNHKWTHTNRYQRILWNMYKCIRIFIFITIPRGKYFSIPRGT